MTTHSQLLTDPFLQMPAENSVRVVWFTEFAGSRHTVIYGKDLDHEVIATTTQLSRTREDSRSQVKGQTKDNPIFTQPTRRNIWRHEAKIENLIPGEKLPYSVASVREDGEKIESGVFTLAPAPSGKQALKILLTSDHQLMPMTAANLEKVIETVGKVDAVFHAGDLVNIPDRASEWFDDDRGGAFFPCLQGRARYELEKNNVKTFYKGGELIQHAPLFTTIGNHEVMGRFSMESSLNEQLYDAYPRTAAQQLGQNADETLLKNNSFNTDTYEEIFTLPESAEGGKKYYAVTFGDVRLVVPFITNVWRVESLNADAKGRYREREQDFNNPAAWGYGQHIFEPIIKGSVQYNWLEKELNSPEFKQAKYKVVMFHHPPHTLGGNIVPAYTDPVQMIEHNSEGNIQAIRYEYPKDADYIIRDIVPLLEAAGVQLVFYGHSHLWNRFVDSQGIHFLETSNVGNSYGAAVEENPRKVPVGYQEDYAATGNPNGLEPVMPTIAPILDENGQPVPYIASNDLTVFSILDTGASVVSSYYFDTRLPQSNVVKFDEFKLGVPAINQQ
ncbi:metallophosphoesterase family protein [Microcoleus sp. FACHB-672]|uniref:metallophosphoesterase family protein n=1 Tax=Microcoleus sp. FACHB-672 TaxID=2692825 RepID=UPI0016852AF2|nr:metallophosphoesterase [Microcoleus sp. FACHB-672]MBD2041111.1 metallophosphoesterase [Microcoleus sp. FACHB-672]